MRQFTMTAALLASVCLPAVAQEYDFDDPVPLSRADSDYKISYRNFGAPFYPHLGDRDSPAVWRFNNRGEMRYPPGDRRSRYELNYGFPVSMHSPLSGRYARKTWPAYDDPNPFDRAYSDPSGRHYIPANAENFRGGRYATDYPGFRGGWYGRGHRVRIRAGEYTADDYANAFWEHQHRARAHAGMHNWNWISGQ